MSKRAAQGEQLFYGQIRSMEKTDFKKLCDLVSGYCTAKRGEVELVIDGLIYVMKVLLESGNIIQRPVSAIFRMVASCKGSATMKEFDPALFKKGRIIFTLGSLLRELTAKPHFEKLDPFSDPTRCQ